MPDPQDVLALRPTSEMQQRADELLAKTRNGGLDLAEQREWKQLEFAEHIVRMARYCVLIAEQLGFPRETCDFLYLAAQMHDIGKIGVPDAILLKPGPLNANEWEEMRRHPDIGFQILRSIPFLRIPAEIVLSHQERFDGRGYPRGLRGEEIPLGARIFAVADTLEAMVRYLATSRSTVNA